MQSSYRCNCCKCNTQMELTSLGGQYQNTYIGTCPNCTTIWELTDVSNDNEEEEE